MSAIDAYIRNANEIEGLNRYFIGRIGDLKTTHVVMLHTAGNSEFLGAYTYLEDAQERCKRKASQSMQWFDGGDMIHAADAAGNGYVIIRTRVNADYEKGAQS